MKKLLLVTLLLFSSCKLGPDFDFFASDFFKDVEQKKEFRNDDDLLTKVEEMSPWWQTLNDEVFEDYVVEMLDNNYSFKQSYEQMIQAKENYKANLGGFFPEISNNSSASRTITPVNSLGFFDGPGKIYNTIYDVGLDVSWQLDFFGKIRRQVEVAKNSYEASQEDLEALRHSLIADLFKSKIAIALYKNLADLALLNLDDKQDLYDLLERRYKLGSSQVLLNDVNLAKKNLGQAKIEYSNYENLLEAQILLFESLLGSIPSKYGIYLDEFELIELPNEIISCMSANLIDRRPDLRAARLRLLASNAEIGVAIADLYPNFSISAATGFSGNESRNLFEIDQLASSLSGNIATKLFQGGALRVNVRIKKAKLRELSANYANKIIKAIMEVESYLKAEVELAKQYNEAFDNKELMQKNADYKYARFEVGASKLQEYLVANADLYNASKEFLLKWQESWNNRVNLYLALGGDWQETNICEDR